MRPKRQTYRIFYLLVYIFTAFIIHYPAINFKGFKEKFIKFIPPALQFPPHMCFSRRGPASRLKHIWGGNCSASRIHDYDTASFQSG